MKWLVPLCLPLGLGGAPLPAAEFERTGLTWRVLLSNTDVQKLNAGTALLTVIPEPTVVAAVSGGVAAIDLANEVGGRNGVEISGILGVPGAFLWPQGKGSVYRTLVETTARAEREGRVLADHWGGILRGFGDLWSAGWGTQFGLGRISGAFGRMRSDRTEIGPGEKCRLVTHPDGAVSLAFHTGFVTARHDGAERNGTAVAATGVIGDENKFRLERAGDKVMFKNVRTNTYLSASRAGASDVRDWVTTWYGRPTEATKFTLVANDDGTFSLRTSDNRYVRAEKP